MEPFDAIFAMLEGFQWDAGNSDKNWRSHRVSQLESEQVFFNRPLVSPDLKHSATERRFFALGQTDASRELAVVFTIREKLVRVISARLMSRRERREYVRAKAKNT